ncbi:diacylglycerol/lipid kinase family protein [Arthrobacter sp.]|uniref:diacylglycerol/lipid kinase family protein n=1 Tax=Arthrobacter sp. TaxID=1667 RepID=UPI003A8C8DD5
MNRAYSFLVNRSSGGGSGVGAVIPVARLLREAGATVEVSYSPGPRATLEAIGAAVERGAVVVSVGGDGMLSSIAGEVSRLGGTLGILPAGRGNDFARMIGLGHDPEAIARTLLEAEPVATDLISATLPDGARRCVAGSVYAGVDAQTADLVNRLRWLPRKLQYPAAAVTSLARFVPSSFAVTVDGSEHRFEAACVVVANSGYYGSGMHIAPSAAVDDGELEVVVITATGRLDMIRAFPKVYDGSHIGLDQVRVLHGKSISISARPTVSLGGDGEPLGMLGVGPLRIEVDPGALRLLR